MKAWGLLAAAAVAIGAAGLAPATAAAKPGYEVRPGGFAAVLSVQGSDGWAVSVTADGHKRVTVTTAKGLMSATYTVRGRASRHGVWANLGRLGRIAVRFEPAPGGRQLRRLGNNCKGRPAMVARGSYRGTLRFRGERGFTNVSSRRAKGAIRRWHRSVCKGPPARGPLAAFARAGKRGGGPKITTSALGVESRAAGSLTSLFLLELDFSGRKPAESGSFVVGVAGQRERRGRVAIARSLLHIGGDAAILAAEPKGFPVEATVALPKPFSGTAAYREEKGATPSWGGDLAVWLPGAGRTALTGESFKAGLCMALGKRKLVGCLKRIAATIPSTAEDRGEALMGQISGSQSQLFGDARLSWSR